MDRRTVKARAGAYAAFRKKLRKNHSMRSITIPPLLVLTLPTIDLETGLSRTRKVPFADFINENLLADKKFIGQGTIKDLRRAQRVLEKFIAAQPGEAALLDTTDWELLKGICEEPTGGWNAYYGRQLLPYINAVLDAVDVPVNPPPPRAVQAEAEEG